MLPNPGVLITRPAHQAGKLAEMIRLAGGRSVIYPTLVITPLLRATRFGGQALPPAEIIIFTSVNAVRLFDWMPAYAGMTAAIGAATAQELKNRGIQVDYVPKQDSYNSEGLLAILPNVKNKTVMIIKGRGGRELLAQELRKRGANIVTQDVYERTLPNIADLPDVNLADIDVIISTSKESLENLVKLLDGRDKQLIVISERVARYAQELGFSHPPIVADNASDAALVAAFVNWRNQQ